MLAEQLPILTADIEQEHLTALIEPVLCGEDVLFADVVIPVHEIC